MAVRSTATPRRFLPRVAACFAGGVAIGLLLVWLVHVEVRVQLDRQPDWFEALGSAPTAPVLASRNGVVLNFVKPDHVMDFEALVAKVREAPGLVDWKVLRARQPAPDGSIVYVFATEQPRSENDDLLMTLSQAFPDESLALFSRYAKACASTQKVVRFTPIVEEP